MGSLAKLALLVAVVAFAWFGWRWFERWERERRIESRRREREAASGREVAAVEDLRPCAVCGAFVARGARACGRAGCPNPA